MARTSWTLETKSFFVYKDAIYLIQFNNEIIKFITFNNGDSVHLQLKWSS